MVTCPNCDGDGEVRHPRWGARNCPSPEIICPWCRGKGEVSQDTADAWDDEHQPITIRIPDYDPNNPEEPF